MLAVYPIGMGVMLLTIVVDQSHLVVAHKPALYQLSGFTMVARRVARRRR